MQPQSQCDEPRPERHTRSRGTLAEAYRVYLDCADDGTGGDLTRDGAPLLTYDEWLLR